VNVKRLSPEGGIAMGEDVLKEQVGQAIEIASELPKEYRAACFAVLLHTMMNQKVGQLGEGQQPKAGEEHEAQNCLAVVMNRLQVTEPEIRAVVDLDEGRCAFIRGPSGAPTSRAQIAWALLGALRSGLLTGKFEVDAEYVRELSQEAGCYDGQAFASNFKAGYCARYFDGPVRVHSDPRELTPAGEAALGRLIQSISRRSQGGSG
jgi:hypothetical protein